ncbi:hypothetical protein ACFQ23_05635 [Schaalia naturae]|uniref:hypothetical protein n=1 Tax=Schaalia naturae TaxID=635203 RepID=UPI0036266410
MTVRRRPRGSLVEPRRVGLTLEAGAIDALVDLAAKLGVTQSALAQWLIENVQLDEDGIPVGWDETHLDEELPIQVGWDETHLDEELPIQRA